VLFFMLNRCLCVLRCSRVLLINRGAYSIGSYRLKSECRKCPNTAWLLFFGFSFVIVSAVALAVFLSMK
jgi:hypothetical protein